MKRLSLASVLFPLFVLGAVSGTAWALRAGAQLTLDGNIVSTDVQTIHGKVYVPIGDVARVLSQKVTRSGKNFALIPGEPGHSFQGIASPFSTNVYSGQWRFNVESVQKVAEYRPLYGSEKERILPREANDTLVTVSCHLRNGSKEMQEVYFDSGSSGNTALTDNQEHGYVPVAFDSRNSNYSSSRMPSGTRQDFIIIFSVPKDAVLKNLVYSVGGMGGGKTTEFRVALKP